VDCGLITQSLQLPYSLDLLERKIRKQTERRKRLLEKRSGTGGFGENGVCPADV
jgi:hypothetical protein